MFCQCHLVNFFIGKLDDIINFITFNQTNFEWNLSLKSIFGIIFAPIAFFMGVDPKDILEFGNLLGTKISINELVAYLDLTSLKGTISERSYIIGTYALCGFAHLASMAIFTGGICALAPNKTHIIASVSLRALLAATLACLLTACIAGTFFTEGSILLGG